MSRKNWRIKIFDPYEKVHDVKGDEEDIEQGFEEIKEKMDWDMA